MAAGQVVKVKRDTLEACMTCPLCHKLLKEATTISLCLHTFCRKCIYEKLSDEEVERCPVCNIDLGVVPVEKLRPDHNLQDIRAKIFPYKRKRNKSPEVTPSISLPAKRKERSLSSLVAAKVPSQTGVTGRRSKANARKAPALRGTTFPVEESIKKEDSTEDHPMGSSSPKSPNKVVQNKKQDLSAGEPSNEQKPNIMDDEEVIIVEGRDLWTPLTCLVEAANRSKSSKSNSQGPSLVKSDRNHSLDSELHLSEVKPGVESPSNLNGEVSMPKTKIMENGQGMKVQDDKNGTNSVPASLKRRRLTAARKRAATSEELRSSAQVTPDAAGAKDNGRNCPIWFSLIASDDQKGDGALPQISAGYLRIKNGKMPVSLIQKYLVKKLDLSSEAEVEIKCRGQLVRPTLQLQDLADLWFRTGSISKKVVTTSVGAPAKDFVMVLSYCRRVEGS